MKNAVVRHFRLSIDVAITSVLEAPKPPRTVGSYLDKRGFRSLKWRSMRVIWLSMTSSAAITIHLFQSVHSFPIAYSSAYPEIPGPDPNVLRQLSSQLQAIYRQQPDATRVRDDWGEPAMAVQLTVDPDRANLSGVINLDVALSSTAAVSGLPVGSTASRTNKFPSRFA